MKKSENSKILPYTKKQIASVILHPETCNIRGYQVYKKLDFMVVLDRFMTEDAKYADVVLPAATLWENDSFCEYPGGIRLREQIIGPVGEAKAGLSLL